MNLLEQLKRDEGCRLRPYKDSVGKTTIGYGRNLDDIGISQEEAEALLQTDADRAVGALIRTFPWAADLDEVRQAVLANMTFNMGIHGLAGFKNTLSLVQQWKFSEAADAMLDSKWATQVGARAHRLAEQLRSGLWV